MDDPFVSCPYNISHRVPRSRIQSHLVRCKEKDPSFVICPYNATHRFPESEMQTHVLNCPSKAATFPQIYQKTVEIKPNQVKLKPPPMDDEEQWDE